MVGDVELITELRGISAVAVVVEGLVQDCLTMRPHRDKSIYLYNINNNNKISQETTLT